MLGSLSFIAQYNDIWSYAGSLKQPRYGHGAITVHGITMIIGGIGTPFNETTT